MPTRRTLLLLTALVIVVTRAGSATVTAVARTEEYRNKCLLDFSSRLFGISPGNFLWNENFLFKFFEVRCFMSLAFALKLCEHARVKCLRSATSIRKKKKKKMKQ